MGNSLNKSREEMNGLGDPVWERLQRECHREMNRFFDLYDERLGRLMQLEEKMIERTMTEKEYDAILKGKHPYLRKTPLLVRIVHDTLYLVIGPDLSHPMY